jgi:PKD repeat protein
MKRILLLLLTAVIGFSSYAQHRTCYSTEVMAIKRANDPAFDQQMRIGEDAFRKYVAMGQPLDPNFGSRAVRTIPVVVHVVLTSSQSGSITDAAIQTMINQMNVDYSKTNSDLNTARAAVLPLATNTEIQFCLAQQKPDGTSTNGIERKTVTKTCWNYNTESDNMKSTANGGLDPWNPTQYLNVWIVSICGSSPQTGGVAGYAYVPAVGNPVPATIDGLVVDYSIGMGAGNRTWTHEVGHYLGLHHTWGDLSANACGNVFPDTDDGFSDTPDSKEANFGCSPTVSCAGNSSYGDQVENYMDYSDCTVLFTPQQSNYMNNILTNVRSGLVTNNNKCSATGAPIASFTASSTSVCVGQTVTFTNTSTGSGNTYSWTFQGGTPGTSTATNPTITYNTAGTYNVTLVATNSNGSNTATQTAYITVSGSNALPLTEGFESATFPPSGWVLNNADASTTWARTTSASGYGTSSASAYVNNFSYQSPGQKDWLITPAYNFTGVSNGRIRWEYAYAAYNTSSTYADSLIVLYSTNCGATWTTLWQKGGTGLGTASNTTNNFVPTAAQWKRDSVSLSSLSGQSSVRFAFKNACSYGNNVFLDNINIFNASAQQASAPVADFVGTPTTVVAGNTVTFTDLSTNSPTNWSWTFGGGGTPNTSTAQNPTITFSTPGVYTVSLTASNSNGNNTATKTNYITVIQGGGTQSCDTLSNLFTTDSLTVYLAPDGGYLSGQNAYGDKSKAQYYTNSTSQQVTGAIFYFAWAESLTPNTSTITATVWDATGAGGTPGTALATQAVTYNTIITNRNNNQPTTVTFSNPPTVTGNFYVGFQMTYASGDTVILYTSTVNSPDPDNGWEQWSDDTWHSYLSAWGVGLDNWIFPIVCTGSSPQGPTAAFTASGTAVCAGSSVTFTSTSTGSPTSYSWSFTGGSPTASSSQNPTVTYNTPGTYNVALTVSNANGNNTSTQTNYITVYARPTLTTNATAVACYGGSTGSATVTAASGTPAYTYSWSGGGTSATISNKPAGTYTVTVNDSRQCSATASVNIGQPLSALTASVNATDAACGQANGSVTVTATGGGGSYVYYWNTAATTQSVQNLGAGTYTVTVTDFAFCTATASGTVATATSNFAVSLNTTNASCGLNNGSVVALPNNPTGVTYQWSSGATSGSITGLAAGTYSVTATNPAGCTATASTVISSTPANISVTFNTTQAACGQSNGGATATVSGGNAPYIYNWSTGSTTNSISNVAAGGYALTVTDNGGCSVVNTATISNSGGPTVNVNTTAPTCFGGANGSATASATGGTQPYSYNWSTGSTNASVSGLAAGTYTVSVYDNTQCLSVKSVTVTSPTAINVAVSTTNALCGQQNGSAVASASNGTGNYNYQWSNGSTLASNTDLAAGTYNVTVTDGNSCTATASAVVSGTQGPNSVLTPINGTCQIAAQINVTVAGGTSPYTYAWSNGATTQNLQGISAGSYTVTITDANGCRNTNSASVTDNSSINVTFNSQNPTIGNNNGSVTANPTGGTSPYNYSWNNGSTNASITGLAAGTYTVTITDNAGCTKVSSVTLEAPNAISDINAITFVKLYPNPATESVNIQIELSDAQHLDMKMLNNVGQIVWSRSKQGFRAGIETVDVSTLASGVYIVQVSVNGNLKSLRFVKE